MKATGMPSRATMFHGAVSQCPMTPGLVAEVPAVPGEPHRSARRPERAGRLVQGAQQPAERVGAGEGPRPGLGELALDERQDLTAAGVQAGADQAGSPGEAGIREVTQQRMHRRGPRSGIADDRASAPVDDGPAAAFQRDQLIGRGHGSL